MLTRAFGALLAQARHGDRGIGQLRTPRHAGACPLHYVAERTHEPAAPKRHGSLIHEKLPTDAMGRPGGFKGPSPRVQEVFYQCPMANGSEDLHVLLAGDHQRLDQIFRELENAVEGADQPTIQHDWGDFERGVLTHFEAEERLIFPLLESEHPAEVERAKKDHELVRTLLANLGVRADLHLLRKDVADELIARLREHAEWEDRTLYPWAQRKAHEETRRSLRDLLMRQST